jgi:Protein of unknown function (DUF3306)
MQNSDDDKKPFLSRWSQRKLQAEREKVATELPAANEAGVADADARSGPAAKLDSKAANSQPEALPTIESVNLESGVAPFFKQQADESLRRLALKKLLSDPHFNVMDGLDIYVGDYSQPDPIPPEMMKKIRHARQWTMTPEEIVEAEKVDVEEELALKLAREEKRAREESLVLEEQQAQEAPILQSSMESEVERLVNAELSIEKQVDKK